MHKPDPDSSGRRVAVGMSGGVDSTMTAGLLRRRGYDVVGVTMQLWDGSVPARDQVRSGCFGPGAAAAIESARTLAERLGIPHHVIPLADEFRRCVLDYFRREYLAGRTPNPCVVCNRQIKFGLLPEKARQAGLAFDRFATGHYARVEFDAARARYLLKRGVDRRKDQSYFLAQLTQDQLRQLVLPLGELTKDQVKALAHEMGLDELAAKPESQDFVKTGDYLSLFEGDAVMPGPIIDTQGRVLGKHRGIIHYTVGQRKGIGLSGRKEPLYVLKIDGAGNTIIVGSYRELFTDRLTAGGLNWIAIDQLRGPLRVRAKIRQQHQEADATLQPLDDGGHSVRVIFDRPQMAVAPGQTVVFYQDDLVLGGGTIMLAEDTADDIM